MCNIRSQLQPDEGPTTLRTKLCETNFTIKLSIHDWPAAAQETIILTTYHLALRFVKAIFSVATSRQLNAVRYLLMFISLAQCCGGKRPCQLMMHTAHWWFCLCTSLASRQMTVVSGLGTRLRVCKNRKWHPKQWTAASECCEWLLLTKVNLKLWRH